MASIAKQIVIDVPASDVWTALRDFGAVHRLVPGLLADCRLETGGSDATARVVAFRGGGRTARELLVSSDDDIRRLVYAEPGGPFVTRSASCQVFAVDDRSSRFVWTQDLLPDELARVISDNMDKALPELKRTLESAHPAPSAAAVDAPAADEEDLVAGAGERETLEGFLEYHRRVLGGKLRGLSEQDARRRLMPSPTTLLGIVSHAAAVERNWFQHHLAGKPRAEIEGNARGDAASWDVAAGRTIADVIAEFDTACATSRRIAAGFAVDQAVPHDELGQVTLRWIYVHIIGEHARHIGHADILREQTDGATGD